MDRLGDISDAVTTRLNRRRFLARTASLLAGGAAAALAPALVRAGSPSDTALRGQFTGSARPVVLIEPPLAGSESLADLLDVPVTRVVDEAGAVRSAFMAHATPHTFLVRDGLVADQILGANVERVLAMLAADTSRALSRAGVA